MQGRRLVVVGAGSGIGRGIACAGAAAGAEIVAVGRTLPKLKETAAMFPANVVSKIVVADATDEEQVIRLFKETGEFDDLVSTIADLAYQPVREFEVAAARRAFDSKLVSSLLLCKQGCERMRAGGSVTFVSGIAAQRPMPGGAVMAAANGGLEALTHALAIECAPIRVNAVSPGWVDTPIWDAIAGDKKQAVQAGMAEGLPVGRIGSPDDIARAVLALISNEFVTGSVWEVDGGHRLV